MHSKDAEIIRLKEILAQLQQDKDFKTTWRPGPDMPFGRSGPVQSTVIRDKLYVGAGNVGEESEEFVVMVYDLSSEKWDTLPPYRVCRFAMAAINNQLVLVGGKEDGHAIKTLAIWRADPKKWTHPYPEMPTARCCCTVAVYDKWLVVAGGHNHGALSSVEVLNTNTKEWHTAPSLPTPACQMKTAVVGDTFYLMGGLSNGMATGNAFSVSIPALIHHIDSEKEPEEQIWKEVDGLKLKGSAPLSFGGSLFAVGGKDTEKKDTAVTDIHQYRPCSGKWVKIGKMPTARSYCTCKWVAERKVLVVAGGWDCAGGKHMKTVDVTPIN